MGLDTVELVMAWEKEFGIDIPNDIAATLETPRKAIDWIYAELVVISETKSSPALTRDQVRKAVRRVTMAQTGLKNFNDDDTFVQDMGLD